MKEEKHSPFNRRDKKTGQGALPEKCPRCNQANLEWGEKIFDESMSQQASCPKCNAEFLEIHRVDYWEES